MARFYNPIPAAFDYTDGSVQTYNPLWSGDGLVYSGTPTTGSYVKIGKLINVQIDVLCTTVSNFGTGQYKVTLPFLSRYHTDVFGGSVHAVNASTDHYSLKGHLSPSSNIVEIWDLSSSGKDEPFDHNSPIVLRTVDKFHMSFSYIKE